MKLISFLTTPQIRAVWVAEEQYMIFVRRSFRVHPTRAVVNSIDIANITNHGRCGTGTFWSMVQDKFLPHAKAEDRVLYIENVINARLAASLRNRGWIEANNTGIDGSPCFFHPET